jgi:heptosyltransferase-3
MVKDAVPLGECGRALVIKLRHHGDVLLAAPVLTALKARGVEVDALVYDDTRMLQGHPALSQLHVVGRKWKADGALSRLSKERRLFADLKKRGYGLVVHLSEQPRGAWLARTLGARYSVAPRIADRGAFWAKSFTHLFPIAPRRHMVEVNLDALRRIGVQPIP